jgi:hypothetical protein
LHPPGEERQGIEIDGPFPRVQVAAAGKGQPRADQGRVGARQEIEVDALVACRGARGTRERRGDLALAGLAVEPCRDEQGGGRQHHDHRQQCDQPPFQRFARTQRHASA